MLKEILFSAGALIGSNAYSQDTTSAQINSSEDSLLIELISKDYAIDYAIQDSTLQDSTLYGKFPLNTQIFNSYEKLKQDYAYPERIDSLVKYLKQFYPSKEDFLKTDAAKVDKKILDSLFTELLADTLDDPITTYLIGRCYIAKFESEKGLEYCEKAISQGLEFFDVYIQVADAKLAKIGNELHIPKDILKNKKNLNEVARKNSKKRIEDLLKESQELIPFYQKAIELNPNNKIAYYHLAEVYELNEMYAEAFNTINKVFEIEPIEFNDYLHRMIILENMFENKDLSEDVKMAVKKRYLKDIEVAYFRMPVIIGEAYIHISTSGIFTEQEIKEFKEKYEEEIKISESIWEEILERVRKKKEK